MQRRRFFTNGLREIARDFIKDTPVGRALETQLQGFANLLDPRGLDRFVEDALQERERKSGASGKHAPAPDDDRAYARPPGALPDPDDFDAACTRCGDCATACPYGAIFLADDEGGPVLDPNVSACRLCKDWPCIQACEPEALLPLKRGTLPKMGQAVLKPGACLNEPNLRIAFRRKGARYCRECESYCPVEDVIRYDSKKLPRFADHCTGCGLCVAACPAHPVAIQIEMG